MDSSDDEDLKRAISLSLDTQGQEIIHLDSDEENAASKHSETAKKKPAPASVYGLLGIDRRKMEEERLARKRKASTSPPPDRRAQKCLDADINKSDQHGQQPTPLSLPHRTTSVISTSQSNHFNAIAFSKPVVKKTWAFRHPRIGNDIKLEEVLQKTDLNLAVLSSFQWDMEWLMAKLDTTSMLQSLHSTLRLINYHQRLR